MLIDCFSPSTNFRTVTVLQILAYLLIGYKLAPQDFNVTLDVFLWSINLTSPLTALLVPLITCQELASCMSLACRIHSQTPSQYRRLPLHLFLFMITIPYCTIVHHWVYFFKVMPYDKLFFLTLYDYTYTVVAIVEINFCCFCFIGERNLSHIRNRLIHLKQQHLTVKNFNSLKGILNQYLEIAQFISNVNDTFSIHFFNIFCSFAFRLTAYAAYFIQLSKTDHITQLIVLAIHEVYQISRLIFFCYRCEKLKEKVSIHTYSNN